MDKQKLLDIITKKPWLTFGQITKLAAPSMTGVDSPKDFVKRMISELKSSELIKSIGKGRGTRYATQDAPSYEPEAVDPEIPARTVALIESGKRTTSEIASELEIEPAELRKILKTLLASGQIKKTGNKRSTKYWPSNHLPQSQSPELPAQSSKLKAPARSQSYKPQSPQLEAVSETTQSPQLEAQSSKLEPIEAFTQTLANLPIGKVFALDEFCKRVTSMHGAPRYQVSRLITDDRVFGEGPIYVAGGVVVHMQMQWSAKRGYPGWNMYMWRPEPGEAPPAPRQDAKFSELGALSSADLQAMGEAPGRRLMKAQV
jgi:DNA-binding Lrp family transcriptional regulator